MLGIVQRYCRVFFHAIPSLVAIMLVETVNVQVYLHGPVSKSPLLLLAWLVLQMVPGFVFAYISDHYLRKKMLVVSQLVGLIGGTILLLFGFETWVLVLIALTFNPMPVARAAFIDNFPQHSMLKLIAITFLAQYAPWAFYNYLAQVDYTTVVVYILFALAINSILTAYLFNDKYDKKSHQQSLFSIRYKLPIVLTLVAFTFSETTFYLLWTFLEVTPSFQSWQSITSYATLIGICMAMLYNRLPHISVITLFYSIGAGMLFVVFIRCLTSQLSCDATFVNAMGYYAIVGGLYLPFVTVAVIDMFGLKHKAVGSATIELGDTIASFAAPVMSFFANDNVFSIVLITVILYIIASLTQRYSEKVIKSRV